MLQVSKICILVIGLALSVSEGQEEFLALQEKLASRGHKFDIASLEEIETMKTDEVVDFLSTMGVITHSPEEIDLYYEAYRRAGRNPNVERFMTERVRSFKNDHTESNYKLGVFRFISMVDSEWAMRLAGDELIENEELKLAGDLAGDLAFLRNNHVVDLRCLAAWSLGQMGIEGYPGPESIGAYPKEMVDECRNWWIANKEVVLLENELASDSGRPGALIGRLDSEDGSKSGTGTEEDIANPQREVSGWVRAALLSIVLILFFFCFNKYFKRQA